MIEFGYSSPEWMARAIVTNADSRMLRAAVINLISHLNDPRIDHFHGFELVDRILQITMTGKYVEQVEDVYEDVFKAAEDTLRYASGEDRELTPEEEAEIQKFREEMDSTPTAEDPFEGWKLDDKEEDQ